MATLDKQTEQFIDCVVARAVEDSEVKNLKGLDFESFSEKFKPMVERLMKETVARQEHIALRLASTEFNKRQRKEESWFDVLTPYYYYKIRNRAV